MGDITISRIPTFPNQQPMNSGLGTTVEKEMSFSAVVNSLTPASAASATSAAGESAPEERNPIREMSSEEIAFLDLTPGGSGTIDTRGNTSVFGAVPLNKASEDAALTRSFDDAAAARFASVYRTTYRLTGTDHEVAAEGLRRDQLATRIADNTELWGGAGGAPDKVLPELGDAPPSDAYARSLASAGVDLSWLGHR